MSRAIFEGLNNFGAGISNGIVQSALINKQGRESEIFKGLLAEEDPDILAIAGHDPQVAQLLQGIQQQEHINQQEQQQLDMDTLGNIAMVAHSMEDPAKIRAFLTAQAQQGHSEGVLAEIADTLNMDDDQMMNDLRVAYNHMAKPEEMKVGRYREITLPDGTVATLDTATNAVTEIAKAEGVDLSVLPDDLKNKVKDLPRDQQIKAVEQYASPATQAKLEEKEGQDQKAQRVKDDTKRLVTELLNNEEGVRAAIGGFDEIFPTFSDSTKDAEAALSDLTNLLTVDNLKLMSGVLSESDIKILASVGSNGLSGSDDRVWGSLHRLAKALGVETGSAASKQQKAARSRSNAGRQEQNIGRFKVRAK